MLFGSHLSIAGSMCNALAEAQVLGMDTVQVFTKNQQQWKANPLDPGMVKEWNAELARRGWDKGGPTGHGRVVSHASYLINLASCQDELFKKSVDLMTDEVERCETLHIPLLVHHPGSFVGWTLPEGIARIAHAYKELFKRTKGFRTVVCLEGTAGSGSSIGGSFEHLRDLRAAIIAATGEPARVAFCLDTCHLHAAGYDMSTRDSAAKVMHEFDAMCGLTNLHCFHLNDSLGALGTHLDRHTHIGDGFIGAGAAKAIEAPAPTEKPKSAKTPAKAAAKSALKPAPKKAVKPPKPVPGEYSAAKLKASGFAAIVNLPRCANIPLILETPKEEGKEAAKTPPSKRLDTKNLQRLRSLVSL